jgi:spoIIIJ-associated protein
MEWVETTGRTVADALDAALDQLGVDEDDVEFEVIQEPKSGLLGRREARIRARVKPISREKPGGDRRRRKGREGSGGGGSRNRSGRGAGRSGAKRTEGGGGGAPKQPAPDDEDSGGAAAAATGTSEAKRRRRGGRGRGGGGNRPAPRASGTAEAQEDRVSEVVVTVEEQADAAADFTRGLVVAFGFDADVSTRREDEDTVIVDVTGGDLGLLVGPKGVTLQAIEELVRTAVQRQTEGHGARIHVDVGGYRAKRRAALEQFAISIAEEVRDSGEGRALEPMSASDRKAVHDAVADFDGVETSSEGEDPRRRVVISPA